MASEYSNLLKIQDSNAPSVVTLLPTEQVCYINLNTRKIEKVSKIIVKTDHHSEILYFKVNRFYDNMDLANTICLIQYQNAKKEKRIYAVPFYDLETFSNGDKENDEPLILFPWVISHDVTKQEGEVTYSLRFYKVDNAGESFTYSLSTLPDKISVLKDIDINLDEVMSEDEYSLLKENYLSLLSNAAQASQEGSLNWIVIE